MSAKIEIFPGTPLKTSDLEQGHVFLTEWKEKAFYNWDCGIAVSRFLDGLRRGQILGVRCNRCNLVMTPPRIWCMRCFKPVHEYIPLQDTGTVNTFSISYVRWDTFRLKNPQLPAVIEIDGASPGMGFLHLLGGVNATKVRIGMRVRAVWLEPSQRRGAITDIKYFRPIRARTQKGGTR